MIVACPKCKSKYRVDETKIGDEGVRLRCQNCQTIFRVKKPAAAPPAQAAAPPAPSPPAPTPSQAPPPAAAPPAPAPAAAPPKAPPPELVSGPFVPDVAPKATILIADVDEEYLAHMTREVVQGGYTVYQARDGISAVNVIREKLPEIAILEVVLPNKFGFEISEQVKADPSLKDRVKIILLGSVYEKERFRRAPQSLYGADSYVEKHHNGKEVLAKIAELLQLEPAAPQAPPAPRPAAAPPTAPPPAAPPAPAAVPPTAPPPPAAPPAPAAAPPAPAPAAVPQTVPPPPAAPPAPVAAPPAPAPAAVPPKVPPPSAAPPAPAAVPSTAPPPAAPPAPAPAPAAAPPAPVIPPGSGAWAAEVPGDPAHQKAARLARTTVADIALYNPNELEQGLRDGNWRDILAKDIEDGKKHWESKTAPEVRKEKNYFDLALQDLVDRKKKEYGLG